jgi:hypothetical protein
LVTVTIQNMQFSNLLTSHTKLVKKFVALATRREDLIRVLLQITISIKCYLQDRSHMSLACVLIFEDGSTLSSPPLKAIIL